ncbi:DNA-binding protein [Patellaria atrata CBS 101060]|uniref:DNA-binding protein n=1 Tax=Patellaria atrata CBS 101060 TaxID=1346257 RepID=A0A9P4VW20_9PEZI|nr:DNA-binding protein [Patellaria atrata CBS 101060]
MASPTPPNTFNALISTFTSFLTVAIHTIIYIRSIYPHDTFLTVRAYNYPIYQSRHPAVCSWINDAVAAIEAQLLSGIVERIAIVIFSPNQKPLERFVFDVARFPDVGREDRDVPFAPVNTEEGGLVEGNNIGDLRMDTPTVDLEEQFRATMSKLVIYGSQLKPLPPNCSFTVAVESKKKADPLIGHPQPWIPTQPSFQTHRLTDDNEDTRGGSLGGTMTLPVRSVAAGEMVFEMWIEEGKEKSITLNSLSGET